MLHHHCGGKLGGAVAVGMGNTLGHGPAGKQAGDAWSSRGEPQLVASQECNVARGEDHNVVCVRLRQQNLEEVFLQFGRLAIACFFICSPLDHSLLLHFSSVRLASAYFFLEILLCHDIALQPSQRSRPLGLLGGSHGL